MVYEPCMCAGFAIRDDTHTRTFSCACFNKKRVYRFAADGSLSLALFVSLGCVFALYARLRAF